jgi:hypothetical protein
MKMRRFSEIDLARFVALESSTQLEAALGVYETGGGFWSYEPVRSSTSDIVGAATPLYGALGVVDWVQLEHQITLACKHGERQISANTEVGKLLFDETAKRGLNAVKFQMGRMPIGSGETVRFWSDVVLADEDGPFIPFFDHRRAHGINAASRKVVYSLQHLWLRERHPDLSEVRLAVIRFPSAIDGRSVKIDFHENDDLMSYEELDARVRQVYQIWESVVRERAEPKRKSAVGGQGSLF